MSEIAVEVLLPEPDMEFLLEKDYDYNLIKHGASIHLILKNFPFSDRFTPREADLLIMFHAGYPNAKLDMFWTSPEVRYQNGSLPAATNQYQDFHNRSWQRWSRHGDWRGGVDNLRSFISTIKKETDI
jgi:hypothetical protein